MPRFTIPVLLTLCALLLLPTGASARTSQFTMFEAPRELLSDDAGVRWARIAATFRSSQGVTSTVAVTCSSGTVRSAFPTAERCPPHAPTAAWGCVDRYRALGCQGSPASG